MRTDLYLKEIKPENLIASVELEVVPRGIYQVGDKLYQYTGQPKFVISEWHPYQDFPELKRHCLDHVELIVEEYQEPTTHEVSS